MKHALMVIDPGSTTGVAMAVLDRDAKDPLTNLSNFQTYSDKPRKGETPTTPYERVAMRLFEAWMRFRRTATNTYGVHPYQHLLVSEDYVIKATPGSTKREALSPVFISMTLAGIRTGVAYGRELDGFGPNSVPPIQWSPPANKSMVSDDALRRAKLWTRGAEHCRDANRHLVFYGKRLGYTGLLAERTTPPPPFYT